MNELKPFDDALAGLIANLSPKARKALAVTVAKRLRASQQQRIKRQQAPDGTPYATRKSQPVRNPKGRIKREMFVKLRAARYMKANSSPNDAVVEFAGRVKRMAAVHHFGLRDRPNAHSKDVQYDERPLLGFGQQDIAIVEDLLFLELSKHS
ncbi:phage virion morphogenesis protein [Yersinia pseudotuberculosis]|uniref:phage virion morphogenesis protein n=1 Tax=Yersinia pseudotuberculosis TaxID=633 RepID=UPI0003A0FEA4|nr:phage virion morphogenesis protein [Yersinia pseudotuberculosis]MBO1632648.1 phage virion morphogenesis protein [Yersinia pseudotuberculosis]MBP0071124.1 phage virion morphogenesis protein [Yersinia pseudotuberculosis]PSH12718.1 phage virion morphogenesis protein [Yersinia pseudotuberculosis]PSH23611.1 phage virion morphogenesis protein [Yersinia pseudotuberculosis]PSH35746.1 phage virion morphogenesis protein [Yersinia pseudotuberculosis]